MKAGILLCLVGGVSMENRRGNIHVLMVGDPGLGKSQLLRAASALSTRGVFVCGNTASGSGLTVTMSRDKVGRRRELTGRRQMSPAWKLER